jgi:Kef-type K+ transport system membrane component KefB
MLFMLGLEIDLKKIVCVGRACVLVATALVLSRYVLPRLFQQIARRPELVSLGALAR